LTSFSITAAGSRVSLDSSGAAPASFTVTNTSAQTLKGRLLTRPSEPAKAEWFSIDGESVRDFAPQAAVQISIVVFLLVCGGGSKATVVSSGTGVIHGTFAYDVDTGKEIGDPGANLSYSNAPIPANADPTNQLVEGDVFAVRSNAGNFAKVKVLSYGYNLGVQWVTCRVGG
jgi:hypothetical protein